MGLRMWLGAVAALMLGAAPAGAATIVATYTGTIKYGFDSTGVFGRIATSLNGVAATFTFNFDTTAPGAYDLSTPPHYGEVVSAHGPAAGTGTVTLRGHSASIAGTTESNARQIDDYPRGGGTFDQVLHSVRAPDLQGGYPGLYANYIMADVQGPHVVDTANYLTPLEYDVTEADHGIGIFQFLQHDAESGLPAVMASGQFFVSHVSITVAGLPPPDPAAVPEPSAWAMMIAGFGMAGARLRRRAPAAAGG